MIELFEYLRTSPSALRTSPSAHASASMADLSKRLDMTLAAVSYAVKRGEKIAKEADCHLDD